MSKQLKPLKIWGLKGINPAKVHVVLKELGLPYESVSVPLSTVKNPEYLTININGRIPALHDPNTDITLWESGAINEYLVETYDKTHKISFPTGTKESFLIKQWLFYQASGQGPYYGQASWFKIFHHEKLPSAFERYVKEADRVTGVLEAHLAQQKKKFGGIGDGPWLVGNKFTVADAVFVPWQVAFGIVITKEEGYELDSFPLVKDWIGRMSARDGWQALLANLKSE
ncbi:putative glutathione S-transferase 1 [Hyaloscypha variabilis F]|uniref:Putative glutathione S-transferase 1 n=1 Tax=Hyaloscypha variabilis (strain UAMH 11265 / GT02V1 / F) TaxID=1149755 RepID=A0A2J6QTC6_HYAVF|nr:putative glutathione S-transferase 1 [Hyaloscypha variabilis F]